MNDWIEYAAVRALHRARARAARCRSWIAWARCSGSIVLRLRSGAPARGRAQRRRRVSRATGGGAARDRAGAFAHFGRLLFALLKFSTLIAGGDAGARRVRRRGARARRVRARQGRAVRDGPLRFLGAAGDGARAAAAADGGPRARARQPAAATRCSKTFARARATPSSTGRAPSGGRCACCPRRRRRHPHRSAHHEPRRDLRRFLRPSGGDDVGRGGAGAAHRRAASCRSSRCRSAAGATG